MSIPIVDMIIRLAISALLSGLIGLEREAHEHPAGLRTHILVSVGATLFTLSSYCVAYSIHGQVFDPGRITAQIVTGVGFLGAGTIIHRGSVVRGLTTAASIWAVAAIGVAVGIGGEMMLIAIVASLFVLGTLSGARYIEGHLLTKRADKILAVEVKNGHGGLNKIIAIIISHGAEPRIVSSEQISSGIHDLRIKIKTGKDYNEIELNNELTYNDDVVNYSWE